MTDKRGKNKYEKDNFYIFFLWFMHYAHSAHVHMIQDNMIVGELYHSTLECMDKNVFLCIITFCLNC